MIASFGSFGASRSTHANACAVSSAVMIPSHSAIFENAAIASSSPIGTYSAIP